MSHVLNVHTHCIFTYNVLFPVVTERLKKACLPHCAMLCSYMLTSVLLLNLYLFLLLGLTVAVLPPRSLQTSFILYKIICPEDKFELFFSTVLVTV